MMISLPPFQNVHRIISLVVLLTHTQMLVNTAICGLQKQIMSLTEGVLFLNS